MLTLIKPDQIETIKKQMASQKVVNIHSYKNIKTVYDFYENNLRKIDSKFDNVYQCRLDSIFVLYVDKETGELTLHNDEIKKDATTVLVRENNLAFLSKDGKKAIDFPLEIEELEL
jgi:hypothetical protein